MLLAQLHRKSPSLLLQQEPRATQPLEQQLDESNKPGADQVAEKGMYWVPVGKLHESHADQTRSGGPGRNTSHASLAMYQVGVRNLTVARRG